MHRTVKGAWEKRNIVVQFRNFASVVAVKSHTCTDSSGFQILCYFIVLWVDCFDHGCSLLFPTVPDSLDSRHASAFDWIEQLHLTRRAGQHQTVQNVCAHSLIVWNMPADMGHAVDDFILLLVLLYLSKGEPESAHTSSICLAVV